MLGNTVIQASANPTNKLTAAVVSTAVIEVARTAAMNYLPGWSDPALWSALSPCVVFFVGWYVPDQPNIVVNMPDPPK